MGRLSSCTSTKLRAEYARRLKGVNSIGFSKLGILTARCKVLSIAAVLKKELQVFCIEAELHQGLTNLVCPRAFGRRSGPSILTTSMLESQKTTVREIKNGLVEFAVDHVPGRIVFGEIRKHGWWLFSCIPPFFGTEKRLADRAFMADWCSQWRGAILSASSTTSVPSSRATKNC